MITKKIGNAFSEASKSRPRKKEFIRLWNAATSVDDFLAEYPWKIERKSAVAMASEYRARGDLLKKFPRGAAALGRKIPRAEPDRNTRELFRQLANERKSVPFATRLEPATHEMLRRLADAAGDSMNETIARLIQEATKITN